MLIKSSRHSTADRSEWARLERYDAALAESPMLAERECKALDDMRAFVEEGPCYLGVSWGKDSVVIADLACRSEVAVPLVWVRVEPIANPDCATVRDAFLQRYPYVFYDEIEVWCQRDENGWHATGTLEQGFAEAAQQHGARYISGVRAEEAGYRKLRMRVHGTVGRTTCAPIGWWGGEEVFAYLHKYDLPVHPAYAMSMGGMHDRRRLRVASLGGQRGTGMGRAEWERHYYKDVLAGLE